MKKLVFFSLLLLLVPARAAQIKETGFIRDNIAYVLFDDIVSVQWGKVGDGGEQNKLVTAPLDVAAASKPETYQLQLDGKPVSIAKLGRKTRPRLFVHSKEGEKNGLENFIYLVLDRPMKPGETLTLTVPSSLITAGSNTAKLTFDPARSRSEAVQVNEIAYLPNVAKRAHVSSWLGDLGAQTFAEGTPFAVLDEATRKPVFSGKLALRKTADLPDDKLPNNGNFYRANLYECDFTGLTAPGNYVVSVDGIGCSFPFKIDTDGYREPFHTMMQGMYIQRCGIALTEPYTHWTRPACHTDPIIQTDHRSMDLPFTDGPPEGATFKETGVMRKDVAGGYHDAADWDREASHPYIGPQLLFAYELTPDHYTDGELNIPESGNGIPDIIDEAAWGIDYYKRVQGADGGVPIGMFESHWTKGGEVSWTDTLIKYMYADEPVATLVQVGAAAHMAIVLKKLGKTDAAKPYAECALRAWAWAADPKNLRAGDEEKIRDPRLYAAAALYRLTGDTKFQDAFKHDLLVHTGTDALFNWPNVDQRFGAWTYALAEDDLPGLDTKLRETVRQAVIHYADTDYIAPSEFRGNRRGYSWFWPFEWGFAVNSQNLPLMMAHKFSGAQKYLDVMEANCDLTLGNNPLNMVWITGLGPRHPTEVMQINYGSDPKGPNPGVMPCGPAAYNPKYPNNGVWTVGWAWKFVYPKVDQWPPYELWFEDRYCSQTNEFTIGRQVELAISLGYLCAPAPKPTAGTTPSKSP